MHRVVIGIPLIAAVAMVFAMAVAGPATGQEQADKPAAPDINAQVYIKFLVKHCSSDDPRLRFSVREGLQSMGTQAVSALNEAKQNEKNKHVRAFIERTLKRIKDVVDLRRMFEPGGQNRQGRQGWMNFMTRGFTNIDIDRIAMDVNLTWEQIEQVEPVLAQGGKQKAELWKVFNEAGGMRDREAWADLREELKTVDDSIKSKLREHLKPQQVARIERYLNPFGGFGRMGGRGGRGGRGPGGGGGGGGFGRERP